MRLSGERQGQTKMNHRRAAVLALCAALFLGACNNKPERHYTLLEVIDVKGTCYEDHVRKADGYAGQIVRWQNDETKQVSTYGHVTNTRNLVNRVSDEADHPTVYHTPFIVVFSDVPLDTNQAKWKLHGISVSDREDNDRGYDSTCELAVIRRGMKLDPDSTPPR
jgi:hypothetical protein